MNPPSPWYRHFWPWFLFGLPALVVIAGLTTWWLAERHGDHLVARDYYKQGLDINRQLDREQLAEELQMSAQLSLADGFARVRLRGRDMPPALVLNLSHSMDAGQDLTIQLPQQGKGHYQAALPRNLEHRWHWQLEPAGSPDRRWRLDGQVTIPRQP